MSTAVITQLDILNAVTYTANRETLSYIQQWRNRFPFILIDYKIRWADSANDYFVPAKLRYKSAVVADLFFSKEGCEAMSCYPYTETGVIDFFNTPIGGYTQTSDTPIQYNQPACFHLDPAMAARNGNIQSVELRYTDDKKCILIDTFTKAWMNSPYIRSSEHVTRGVDDVPGFNVNYDDILPDRILGDFNEAYCRRFGRDFHNGGCRQPWYEIFLSFILGDSILHTFRIITSGVAGELRNFDYTHPSNLLPRRPPPEGKTMLDEWFAVRDSTVDVEKENDFLKDIFPFNTKEQLEYVANKGFNITTITTYSNNYISPADKFLKTKLKTLNEYTPTENTTDDLESILVEFLQDHMFIMGILTDLGFNVLESTLSNMLTQLNKILIPSLRRMLLLNARRITTRLLGETYKAAIVHALNRAFINVAAVAARAAVRAIQAAASIASIVLIFVTLSDFVLMIWDPFGYRNMFPRNFLIDLSNSFLNAHYESVGDSSRTLIQFVPQTFTNLIVDDDSDFFVNSMFHLLEYLGSLEVNSNGQVLNWDDGEEITDFDERDLISINHNDTWAYFKWFFARHDALVVKPNYNFIVGIGLLTSIGGLLFLNNLIIVFILITVCCILLTYSSVRYYTKLSKIDKE